MEDMGISDETGSALDHGESTNPKDVIWVRLGKIVEDCVGSPTKVCKVGQLNDRKHGTRSGETKWKYLRWCCKERKVM